MTKKDLPLHPAGRRARCSRGQPAAHHGLPVQLTLQVMQEHAACATSCASPQRPWRPDGYDLSGEQSSPSRFRLTWIASDGTVLYDTQADAAHDGEPRLSAQEVQRGAGNRHGRSSSRYSATLLQKTVYVREPPRRTAPCCALSASRATMGVLLLGMLQPILLVVIVLLVLSSLLGEPAVQAASSSRSTRSTSSIRWKTTPMRSSLRSCGRIDRQRRQIDAQLARAAAENRRIHPDHRAACTRGSCCSTKRARC